MAPDVREKLCDFVYDAETGAMNKDVLLFLKNWIKLVSKLGNEAVINAKVVTTTVNSLTAP
jgi:hypothetical protein